MESDPADSTGTNAPRKARQYEGLRDHYRQERLLPLIPLESIIVVPLVKYT